MVLDVTAQETDFEGPALPSPTLRHGHFGPRGKYQEYVLVCFHREGLLCKEVEEALQKMGLRGGIVDHLEALEEAEPEFLSKMSVAATGDDKESRWARRRPFWATHTIPALHPIGGRVNKSRKGEPSLMWHDPTRPFRESEGTIFFLALPR
jgi:hypothetical protein